MFSDGFCDLCLKFDEESVLGRTRDGSLTVCSNCRALPDIQDIVKKYFKEKAERAKAVKNVEDE